MDQALIKPPAPPLQARSAISTSTALSQLLGIILRIGNHINAKSKRLGQQKGFKLETLSQLKLWKSGDGQTNLLKYVVLTLFFFSFLFFILSFYFPLSYDDSVNQRLRVLAGPVRAQEVSPRRRVRQAARPRPRGRQGYN